MKESIKINWWLPRVTLAIAFGCLPQPFGKWQGPMNDTFYFFQNEVIFVQVDELDELDKITHA